MSISPLLLALTQLLTIVDALQIFKGKRLATDARFKMEIKLNRDLYLLTKIKRSVILTFKTLKSDMDLNKYMESYKKFYNKIKKGKNVVKMSKIRWSILKKKTP